MPIEFVLPPAGTIGPGLSISWSSTFVGPLPQGSFWRWRFYQGVEPDLYYLRCLQETTTVLFPGTFPFTVPIPGQHQVDEKIIADGQDAHVFVELSDGTNVIDSGTLDAKWDTRTGIWPMLQTVSTPVQGGFTAADRAQLELAVDNSTVQIPANVVGGVVAAGLATLIGDIPPYLTMRNGFIDVTGNGSLPRGAGPFATYTLGIEWLFLDIPAGFGQELGNVEEFNRRIIQLEPVFQAQNNETYWAHLEDAHQDGGRSMWGRTTPVALNYWCAPGCRVRIFFLVLKV